MGLDETVTLLTLLNLSPGAAHCFNVLCDVSAHGHFRCLWEHRGCLKEKIIVRLFGQGAVLVTFSENVTLLERSN